MVGISKLEILDYASNLYKARWFLAVCHVHPSIIFDRKDCLPTIIAFGMAMTNLLAYFFPV
jgi:hypothetical protein